MVNHALSEELTLSTRRKNRLIVRRWVSRGTGLRVRSDDVFGARKRHEENIMERELTNQLRKDRELAVKLEVEVVCGFSRRPSLRLDGANVGNVEAAPRLYAWQLWPGRNWPLTAAEEAQFEADLLEVANGRKKRRLTVTRGEITAVCNAMRCGLTVEELLKRAPGIKPTVLLAAYDMLEKLRLRSVNAWEQIVEQRTLESVVDHGYAARVLVPWGVGVVAAEVADASDEEISRRVDRVLARVAQTHEFADEIEAKIAQCDAPSAVGIELGRVLYDPYDPGVWDRSEFIPNRVGVLTPRRLARMLDEVR
jgi:hypothetical protein